MFKRRESELWTDMSASMSAVLPPKKIVPNELHKKPGGEEYS
jgi:hypothetical protein